METKYYVVYYNGKNTISQLMDRIYSETKMFPILHLQKEHGYGYLQGVQYGYLHFQIVEYQKIKITISENLYDWDYNKLITKLISEYNCKIEF